MKILATFDARDYEGTTGIYEKYSIRAIIVRDGRLAMQCSREGEYKIPGGGQEQQYHVRSRTHHSWTFERTDAARLCGCDGEPLGYYGAHGHQSGFISRIFYRAYPVPAGSTVCHDCTAVYVSDLCGHDSVE